MTVKEIERHIKNLPRADLKAFRNWFLRFDWDAWDHQIERDARTGKLSRVAKEALAAYQAKKTKEI